jgi:ribA/ribD-fused uncharacterized protein
MSARIIKFYRNKDPYGFCGNFFPSKLYVYGRWWKNVEAPYQSQKTIVESEVDEIWSAKTPREARDLGQKVTLVKHWDEDKYSVMHDCVLAKFLQNHDMRKLLLETGDAILVEDSPIDWYWGCGKDGTGQNKLGQVLMEVRKLLKDEPNA